MSSNNDHDKKKEDKTIDKEKTHHMIEFGIQGKAELSSIVVAISIGLFVILQILDVTEMFSIRWIVLSISYWAFYGLGVWTFANHQMYASVSDRFLRKINPDFNQDIMDATKGNFFGHFIAKRWDKTPYPLQRGRMWTIFSVYTVIAVILWFVIALQDFNFSQMSKIIEESTKFANSTG
jgi:hypothetical protein